MLIVTENYQGQGYMRKLMEFAYKMADKNGRPCIPDTDAKGKCDRYVHLGTPVSFRVLSDNSRIACNRRSSKSIRPNKSVWNRCLPVTRNAYSMGLVKKFLVKQENPKAYSGNPIIIRQSRGSL